MIFFFGGGVDFVVKIVLILYEYVNNVMGN